MKILYTLAFVFGMIQTSLSQQGGANATINDFSFPLSSTGDLFQTNDPSIAGLTWSEQAIKIIYGGNLWIGGLSANQQLKLSGELYSFEDFTDYYVGPLDENGQTTNSEEVESYFDVVFTANQADIDTHIAYYDAIENGTLETEFPNGYSTPVWMFQWPAYLLPDLGFNTPPAPFVDRNGDGIYNPNFGDYPQICGDQCLYVIFNDAGIPNTQTNGEPIGVEIHLMMYGYENTGNTDLDNTIFAHYDIINKGSLTLTDTYVGLWADYDLGNPADDYMLTNVKRSAITIYNADETDENTPFSFGFGNDLGALSTMILGGPFLDQDGTDNPLSDQIYSTETNSYGNKGLGFDDGIADNERLGLAHSMKIYGTNNPVTSLPNNAPQYYNFMKGIWKNGANMTHGGIGVGMGDIPNTAYYAPGNTDPLNEATGLDDQMEWTEEAAINTPVDFSAIMSSGPFTLQPDATHHFDVAFVLARESQDPELTVLELMDERLKNIREFFNENSCFGSETVLSTNDIAGELTPSIYTFPNPANSKTLISSKEIIDSIQLVSITGDIVFSQTNINSKQYELDVTAFAAGLYLIKVNQQTIRLVIK